MLVLYNIISLDFRASVSSIFFRVTVGKVIAALFFTGMSNSNHLFTILQRDTFLI